MAGIRWSILRGLQLSRGRRVCLILLTLVRRPSLVKRLWVPSIRPLLLLSILCTILALSTRVAIGRTVLFTIRVPESVFQALAIFRASGRLFWPVHYMIISAGIAGVMMVFSRLWAVRLVLGLALVAQIADLSPLRSSVAAYAREAFQILSYLPIGSMFRS